MVVVELEHALQRAARIILCGNRRYGAASDGADMVAPSGEGLPVRCMQMAMHGVDIYLNSHGIYSGRRRERTGAIREVFGDNSPAIFCSQSDDQPLAGVPQACGKLSLSLLMLEHGFIAPVSTSKSWIGRLRV